MAIDEERHCLFCDQPVRRVSSTEKEIWGKEAPRGDFIHVKTSDKGIPYCGRQFLKEEQTYTEEDRDPNEPA